ncbi:MAG: AAA family ATPase [Planctomycetota bacterium]
MIVTDPPLLRVSVVGGESTGKSTLVAALAEHYQTTHAAEFARDYLLKHGSEYEPGQAALLAQGQIQREQDAAEHAHRVVFTDTDALTTMLWSEYYFGLAHPDVQQLAREHRHDLYILCGHELAWEDDGLRRSPGSADWFDTRLQQLLSDWNRPYVRVTGGVAERLAQATQAVDRLLS